MATQLKPKTSFSPMRRWRIGFDVLLRSVLVVAVVVMANFISGNFFKRFYLNSDTRLKLSPHTLNVLQAITNRVTATLYYDQGDEMYSTISALLNEYHLANPNISIQTVDYIRDAGEAQKVKEQYKLEAAVDKDLVIFDCNGRFKIAPGDALVQYTLKQIPDEKELHFRRQPVAFNGERMFTSLLLAVTNPKPFKAYYMEGDGEISLADTGDMGFYKFGAIVAQNDIAIQPLKLAGNTAIPDDCDLLIIAGAHGQFSDLELQKIDQYLAQGGKLFALFNKYSIAEPTGLEPILQRWGVNVGFDYVRDYQNSPSGSGNDLVVSDFAKHPVVNSLVGSSLYLILPRPISCVPSQNSAGAPDVIELFKSGADSTLANSPAEPARAYPLAAAVEQKPGTAVTNPRGLTRIVVVGDSFAFGNKSIESLSNRDFISYAVNWLLDQTQLLDGIGPKPVTEYKLMMTRAQQRKVRWLLLAALPGGVLLLGGLVWLARRK